MWGNSQQIKQVKNYGVILVVITIIILILRAQELGGKLEKTNKEIKYQSLKNDSLLDCVVKIDSMILMGNYEEALEFYEAFLHPEFQNANILSLRKDLATRLKKQKKIKQIDTVFIGVAQSESVQAAPEEIRLFDSIQFALFKYQAQVANLQRQLNEKSFGEYLIFKSRKGNEVHYVGQVKNGMANGKGVALFNTGSRYKGQWIDNEREGDGSFYWPDGQSYKGNYKDDKRNGYGIYAWPNGDKFIGEWVNDKRNGEGTFYNNDGEIVASGLWEEDELIKVNKGKK